jgi:hypothetical protein
MAIRTLNNTSGDHRWEERTDPHLKIESGAAVVHHHCGRCGRDIVTVQESGALYAVYTSTFCFHRLDDEVTARWLSEPCPGEHLTGDGDDRKRLLNPRQVKLAN